MAGKGFVDFVLFEDKKRVLLFYVWSNWVEAHGIISYDEQYAAAIQLCE